MDDREFEQELKELFKCDFSVGTEKFREELLAHCLEVLREAEEGRELEDEELELFAAAGEPYDPNSVPNLDPPC